MRLANRIGAKLRDASGVSMVLALGIMMVVSVVCVSTLKVASSAPRAAYTQQDLEQSYLAATSAAKLVKSVFDNDKDKALQLLQRMDARSTNDGLTNGFSEDFQLQLSRTGADATIVNKLNTATVTLTKTDDNTVTVSVSGSGYPTSLSLPVQTVVWPSYPNTTTALAKTTYPNGYPESNPTSVTPPEYVRQFYDNLSYENGSEIFFFDSWSVSGGTVSPVFHKDDLCTLIWLKSDGTELQSKNYGKTTPPADPAIPEKASDAPAYYEYQGKDWTVVSSETVNGILVTTKKPTYETIAKQVYTIQWLNGDNTTFLDTKQTTADAREPVTDKTPVKGGEGGFYVFTGWNEGSMSGNVKTYTPRFEATPTVTAKTVIWLDGDGTTTLATRYYPAGGTPPGADSVTISPTPTKTDDTYWYTFNNTWSSSETDGNITYTPNFDTEQKYIIKLMNYGGSTECFRYAYHAGDALPGDLFTAHIPVAPTGGTFSEWGTQTHETDYITVYNPVFTATITWRDYTRGVGGIPDYTSPLNYNQSYTVGEAEPTRAAPAGYRDELYIYTGAWTTSDTGYSKTYTATFTHPDSYRDPYIAQWKDTSVLQTSYINSGSTPVFTGDGYDGYTWKCTSDELQTNAEFNGTTYDSIYLRIYEPVAPATP